MNPKTISKIIIDIVMTVLMLFLMARHLTGDMFHEWIGIGMFALFIVHHILNISWYRNLFRGKYTVLRILQIIINTLIFMTMVGLMISGVMLSRYLFAFLTIRGGMSFARKLHLLSSYWGFVLISLHLGFHWGMIMQMARKTAKINVPSQKRTMMFRIAGIFIAAYGLYAFANRKLGSYMFLKNMFVFWNSDEPAVAFFLDYIAIMGFCVFTAYYAIKIIQKRFIKGNKK